MTHLNQYLEANKQRFLDELFDLLRMPSVSADAAYAEHTNKAAQFIHDRLVEAGADKVEVCPPPTGSGYPIVYGEKLIDPSKPTVLVYGHYDVQPADPLELWETEPFEPTIRKTELHPDGAIFARGACDDKGQMYMHIKAFEMMMKNNSLPCNVKFMIEGEEESGSINLEPFIRNNAEKLACDVVLVSDTSMFANDVPSITTGLRGIAYMEVEVTGPKRDLHSGVYGGAVANPINILSKMIASMHDENNHITIPGFYDDVQELSAADREGLNRAPFSLENYKKDLDMDDVWGETGYTTLERASVRPTLDVNGIWGGYTGEGAKTVLPSKAFAKISMRLVPDQDSHKIAALFEKHFTSIAPKSVKVKVKAHHGGEPAVTPTDSPEYRAASKAYFTTFGKEPIPMREGGSIPIVSLFEKVLGAKSMLMGFGLNSDAIHSPNEHYGLFNYFKGIETIPYFYQFYSESK
jgi:acetylornithine deacetylase/succinyl-diaminopimelate desuccinylase-like protein